MRTEAPGAQTQRKEDVYKRQARTIDFKKFREVADEVGAVLMVDMAHIAGLVAAGLHLSLIHISFSATDASVGLPWGSLIALLFAIVYYIDRKSTRLNSRHVK